MKKKTKQIAEDNRGVAIYARKSRITNKGDSIGVQFKQCAEYAIRELSLDDDYTFINYEDKGLSGYYSDRPDFQRMLHDIEMGKIRAVVCYKLDRIGRKTVLRETDASVAEVARRVGYESQSKFTAAFKDQYGCLPTMYRKMS